MIRLPNERETYLSAAALIGDVADALTSAAQTLALTDFRLECTVFARDAEVSAGFWAGSSRNPVYEPGGAA